MKQHHDNHKSFKQCALYHIIKNRHRKILHSYLLQRIALILQCERLKQSVLPAFADSKMFSVLRDVHMPCRYIYTLSYTHTNVRGVTMASHCAAKHTTMAGKWEIEKVRESEGGWGGGVFVWKVCPDAFLIQSKCVNKLKCDGSSRRNKGCKIGQCRFVMPQMILNPSSGTSITVTSSAFTTDKTTPSHRLSPFRFQMLVLLRSAPLFTSMPLSPLLL